MPHGYLISLSREQAKEFFGCKEDAAARAFCQARIEAADEGGVLDVGETWQAIQRCMTGGSLEADAGEYPLNLTILGGRQMHHGPACTISLVRPDMAGHVAQALAEISEDWFRQQYTTLSLSEPALAPTWQVMQQVAEFYALAAEQGRAVVFFVEY